jgi:hypothetical protein
MQKSLDSMQLQVENIQKEINTLSESLENYNLIHYTEPEMNAMYIHSEYYELNQKYERLKKEHEDLQELFVKIDFELDEIKYAKYIDESDPDYWNIQYEVNGVVPKGKYEALKKDYHLVVKELNKCVNESLELARELDER